VQDIRVQISTIRPCDRAGVGIDANLSKQVIVPTNLFEDRAPEQRCQINHAFGSVRECESDNALSHYLNFGDIDHSGLLRKWVNGTRGLVIHSSIPTDLELGVMELDPLSDQANRSPRDLSIENGPIECDPGCLASISSMKVRRVVIAEEHQNRDPVERADPGHGIDVQRRPDRLTALVHVSEQPHPLAPQSSRFQSRGLTRGRESPAPRVFA
jgi:hypothetical protein